MNRREAIQHLLMLESTVASEFCCYDHERESSRAEVEAALMAIGASRDEVEHAFDEEDVHGRQ